MAGPTYAASTSMPVTALNSVASDNSTGGPLIGWFSDSVSNATNKYLDYIIGGKFTIASANNQAGYIYVYLILSLNDTPTWPASATGTIGTQGTGSFVDAEERDSACYWFDVIPVDTSPGAVVYMKPKSLISVTGGVMPMTNWGLFISTSATTTTTAGLAASGNGIYYTPVVSP